MSIFNIFRKAKQQETPKYQPEKQEPPKLELQNLVEFPKYNMYLEFLDMVKGKRIDEMFYGNTSLIPESNRKELKLFFDRCVNDGLVYVTKGRESVEETFSKKDFVKVLKENNLPISGNKTDLVERIESNIGLKEFYDTGNISDWIKLTDLGKSKLKEYQSEFKQQYHLFKENIYNLFVLNKVLEACNSVSSFKKSYPFERNNFFMTYIDDSLYDKCKTYKSSDTLKKLGVPEMYRDAILNTYCMFHCFADIDYKKEIETIYNGFEQLLIDSNLVKNKEIPFYDLEQMIEGYEVRKSGV